MMMGVTSVQYLLFTFQAQRVPIRASAAIVLEGVRSLQHAGDKETWEASDWQNSSMDELRRCCFVERLIYK